MYRNHSQNKMRNGNHLMQTRRNQKGGRGEGQAKPANSSYPVFRPAPTPQYTPTTSPLGLPVADIPPQSPRGHPGCPRLWSTPPAAPSGPGRPASAHSAHPHTRERRHRQDPTPGNESRAAGRPGGHPPRGSSAETTPAWPECGALASSARRRARTGSVSGPAATRQSAWPPGGRIVYRWSVYPRR